MDRAEPQAAHLRAGVASGLAALSAFLILHAIWIVPIWTIVPVGFVLASAGGAAVGLAYVDVLPRLPTSRPRRWIAVDAAIAAVLAPGVLVGELRGPLPAATGPDGITAMELADVAGDLVLFLVLASAVAAVGGWLLGSRGAARSCAVASFLIALGPGHNIPALAGTAAVPTELAILAIEATVAAVVLVEGHAFLIREPPAARAAGAAVRPSPSGRN
jgi:hypothetical protein